MNQNLTNTDKTKIKVQWVTLWVSLALLVFKFVAYFWTNSNSILSDAMESIVNVTASGFALYSIYYAARPKDFNHPYGHGKMEFITSGIEGGMILIAGFFLIYKGIYNLIFPHHIQEMGFGLIVVAVGAAVNLILGLSLRSTGKKHRSPVLESEGNHILSDSYSSFGLLIGIGIIMWTNITWIDNAVTIFFGGLIIYMGYRIIRKSLKGVLDEADFGVLNEMIQFFQDNRKDDWVDIHNMRLIKFGSHYHFDIHLTLPFYYSIQQGDEIMEEIEGLIKEKYGEDVENFIHIEPCLPKSCEICSLSNCDKRSRPFQRKLEWIPENVLTNKKHELK
ncbi:MAG: cation transporter [Crocinitomicaceae bacterium]|nr:cation transporter [Crocinitomicaceae bacterium]